MNIAVIITYNVFWFSSLIDVIFITELCVFSTSIFQ